MVAVGENDAGKTLIPGVGFVRFDWAAIQRLQDEIGTDFDLQITQAIQNNDLDIIAKTIACGCDKTLDEIFALSPAIIPVSNSLIAALNIAFHGSEMSEGVKGIETAENPMKISLLKRVFKRFGRG